MEKTDRQDFTFFIFSIQTWSGRSGWGAGWGMIDGRDLLGDNLHRKSFASNLLYSAVGKTFPPEIKRYIRVQLATRMKQCSFKPPWKLTSLIWGGGTKVCLSLNFDSENFWCCCVFLFLVTYQGLAMHVNGMPRFAVGIDSEIAWKELGCWLFNLWSLGRDKKKGITKLHQQKNRLKMTGRFE